MADEKPAEVLTPEGQAILNAAIEKQPDPIRAAITAGQVSARMDSIKVNGTDANGKAVEVKRPYLRLDAVKPEGALILDGSADEMLKTWNYGHDLGVRARERNLALAALEGPGKAIERAAQALIKAVPTMTLAQATELVKAQRAAAGQPNE